MSVLEVDLARGSPTAAIPQGHKELFVVARWGYHPLGLVRIELSDKQTLHEKELEAKLYDEVGWELWASRVCGRLGNVQRMKQSLLPPISVAVCTRDRPNPLKICLDALARLDYPAYEVLVVDNASRDHSIRQIVEETGFRYSREDIPGLDWARNRAIREAKHDIIAFIDDDAIASSGWLYGIAYGFSQSEIMAVTGLVLPAELETAAQREFEKYGGMGKGFSPKTIRREDLDSAKMLWASGWGVGTNMAFRRALFEKIGGFDPALDVGTATRGGGDIEIFYRTVAAGYTLHYEPMALVYHAHRREMEALRRQIADNGRSFPAYLLTVARKDRDRRTSVFWFGLRYWLWGWLFKRFIKATLLGDWQMVRFVLSELRGSIGAYSGYRAARRRAHELMTNRAVCQPGQR